MCVTCRFGLHVSGELAANAVVVGADVVKAPASQLLSTMELSRYKIYSFLHFELFFVLDKQCCSDDVFMFSVVVIYHSGPYCKYQLYFNCSTDLAYYVSTIVIVDVNISMLTLVWQQTKYS